MTTVLVTLLAVVVALLAVLAAGLLRGHAELERVLRDLGVARDPYTDTGEAGAVLAHLDAGRDGRRVADIAGSTPDGDELTIDIVGAPNPTMLVFLTSSCTTCVDLWNSVAGAARMRVPGDAHVVVVTKGEEGESRARLRRVAADIPVVMSTTAWDAYGVDVAPYFVYVDGEAGAVVCEGVAETWDHVVSVCEQAIADGRARLS